MNFPFGAAHDSSALPFSEVLTSPPQCRVSGTIPPVGSLVCIAGRYPPQCKPQLEMKKPLSEDLGLTGQHRAITKRWLQALTKRFWYYRLSPNAEASLPAGSI